MGIRRKWGKERLLEKKRQDVLIMRVSGQGLDDKVALILTAYDNGENVPLYCMYIYHIPFFLYF